MPPYDYLIVGGGMTADAAAQAIRAVDANGRIGLLSAEPHPRTRFIDRRSSTVGGASTVGPWRKESRMPAYDYLIVGGGMTADAAAQAIHEVDAHGRIGLLCAEPHPPYNRPPLSQAPWKGEPEASIWRKTESTGATLQLGRRGVGVDPGAKTVTDDRGTIHGYKKLLLATGGTPRRLPLKSEQGIDFPNYEGHRRLRGLAEAPVRVAVIGGGVLGPEIAAALRLP